jgi:NTP pyrophosphatase (non-canonical NTP hydrolase)
MMTVAELQRRVSDMESSRGFARDTLADKCLILGEETGELFKLVRELSGIATSSDSKRGTIDYEVADVVIVICAIANRLGLDIAESVTNKLEQDRTRVWSVSDRFDNSAHINGHRPALESDRSAT